MVFLKVLGSKSKNKISILYKINKGYFEKKINLILLLKKLNMINFFNNSIKFFFFFDKTKKNSNHYNKIFLKYFENKPFYIF